MEKRVTLRDLASATGMHFTTVGLALRCDPRVGESTIAKVQAAALRLGYNKDIMLSALSSYRHSQPKQFSGSIAYITTYRAEDINITESQLLEAAKAHALKRNFPLKVFQINAKEMTAVRLSKLLRARGIQGIIFPPRLPTPGPIADLEWNHFSPIAIGYSITKPNFHRIGANESLNTRLCVRHLRERGYRRVGLILHRELYERCRGNVLEAYMAEQHFLPAIDQVPPLFVPEVEITKARVHQWLIEHRIEAIAVTGFPLEIYQWVQELGYKIPDDIGMAMVSRFGETDHIAGMEDRLPALGEAAVDAVITMIRHHERGLPSSPRHLLLEGLWVERPTVRASNLKPAFLLG